MRSCAQCRTTHPPVQNYAQCSAETLEVAAGTGSALAGECFPHLLGHPVVAPWQLWVLLTSSLSCCERLWSPAGRFYPEMTWAWCRQGGLPGLNSHQGRWTIFFVVCQIKQSFGGGNTLTRTGKQYFINVVFNNWLKKVVATVLWGGNTLTRAREEAFCSVVAKR